LRNFSPFLSKIHNSPVIIYHYPNFLDLTFTTLGRKPSMSAKLWGGRFSGKMDPLMEAFNASLPFDKRLWRVDIMGSQAYAKALVRTGLLTGAEGEALSQPRAMRTSTPPTSDGSPS
jgi:hypothetical protein